ncbi:MAG: hypothetical protein HY515_04450 [Candidatus Aenigmarchaeota archaeon]|nr:hypothetical protein [Candidatus Aenigmarchaeota archaeon]
MDKLQQVHTWATLFISVFLIAFFTFSVAFLSYGVFALPFLSAVLVITGFYCVLKYSVKKASIDFKIMALLNFSIILGFVPGIGMRYMQTGVIGPYLWLSLVTVNLAYSIAMIIYYDIKLSRLPDNF